MGSQLKVTNASMHNYQGAIYAASWTVILRGGYDLLTNPNSYFFLFLFSATCSFC